MTRTHLGGLLRLYRLLSQQDADELAREMGIALATYYRIERGHTVEAHTLLAIWAWLMRPETRAVGLLMEGRPLGVGGPGEAQHG